MLKKCLKYDLQAIGRIWWILAVIMMGAALIAGLGFRALLQITFNPDSEGVIVFLAIVGFLAAILSIFGMIAGLTVSVILVYWRTYTNFYTDEGYLTFTLPVKRSTLYLSKVLTAAIVETATLLVFFLGVGLILLIAPPTTVGGGLISPVVYTSIGEIFASAWVGVGGWLIVWLIALIPLLFLTQLYASGLVFLCMTIGSVIAKKHKLLAAIGIYYAINAVISFVSQFISMFLSAGVMSIIFTAISSGMLIGGVTITAVILVAGLIIACLATAIHFTTVHLLEKKLNLA